MSSKLGQGFVSSCVGPVVDISISTQKHEIYKLQSIWVSLGLSQNRGLLCIYDYLLLTRSEYSFREGIRIQNRLTSKRRFYKKLNKEENFIHGIIIYNKLIYTKLKTSKQIKINNEILASLQIETATKLILTSAFIKTYINQLLVKINQIRYKRTVYIIVLGFTEGISS